MSSLICRLFKLSIVMSSKKTCMIIVKLRGHAFARC